MTGFTGLLSEQALEKYVTLLVGATASASAVVVFTYFLGFALGGYVTARLQRQTVVRRPLRAYAAVELLVGLACAAFSFFVQRLISFLAPLQNYAANEAGRYAIRFGCGCLLVLPIAALMGASFPLIAQTVRDARPAANPAERDKTWLLIYSVNLTGAVLAALLAPYFIIPYIGLRGVMLLCLATCATVAGIVWRRREEPQEPVPPEVAGVKSRNRDTSILLAASFLSGMLFLALEILWTHLISTVIGGSVYAFSAMLASVLGGLLAGSWLSHRREARVSFLLQCAAFTLTLQLWLWDLVPLLFVVAPPGIDKSFAARETYRLLLAAVLIVPAATALGMIYPRLLRHPLCAKPENDWLAGYLSASNSIGCLTGALLAVFVFVPYAGSEASLKAVIVILAGLCVIFRFREPIAGASPRAVAVISAVAFCVAAVPRHWEWKSLTSGAAMYFGEGVASVSAPPSAPLSRTIIFRDEGIQGGFTTVVEEKTGQKVVHSMYTNGKLQGNDDPSGDIPIQFGVAAIPALFATHFDRALLIGLGMGRTAAVLRELGFGQLDIAELSPGVVAAARAEFADVNHRILDDPKVRYTLEDGRNLLLVESGRRYDLITIELTTIWFAGATNLYSKEFYQLAQRRLQPDGVLQQWVQLHRIGPEEVASAIATVRSVFPYVSYWAYAGQGMVMAANHPLRELPGRNQMLSALMSNAENVPLDRAEARIREVAGSELLSQTGVDAMIGHMHPIINTDQNRFIEYSTPKYASAERDWRAYNTQVLANWNR
jgi:spermidine synthase